MLQQSPLAAEHQTANAKLVDFAGWHMPLHYGSQLVEHQQVRQQAGLFDVSHMTLIDIQGQDASALLTRLLANDVNRLQTEGQALYSLMLNPKGGIIDDLIVYRLATGYRLVVNCGTRTKDLAWLDKQAQGLELSINERSDLAMLALQGPQAKELIQVVSGAQGTAVTALKFFHSQVVNDQWLIARTGYTGEDGFEIMLPNDQAIDCWRQLLQAGAQPCGLGARDTLRLEAGMNLYGCDMDEERSPLEVGLGWTVAWQPAQRDFIGRSALLAERQAGSRLRQLGLVLADKGILRNQQKVLVDGQPLGIITSGSFSPTLGQSIALALVPSQATGPCQVSIRNKVVNCTAVKPPFVRKGQPAYQLIEPESN